MNVWKEWTTYRLSVCSPLDCPPHLLLCTPQQLDYWISKFILEVRKADRAPYPPNSLHQIVCSIQRYVREHRPAVNFLKDAEFAGLRRTLDSEMKHLRAEGCGVMPRAEPLTVEEENQLWQCRLLGECSPQALLDTMLFLCGMYFALRSGQEHRNLVMSQIKIVEPTNGSPSYIAYTENVSKNHSDGLAQRKVEPKQVIHHQNLENPSRCLVRLMKLYLSHCPNPRPQTFYLAPLTKPKSDV